MLALVNAHLKNLIMFFFFLHVRISLYFPFLITFTKRPEHLLNVLAVAGNKYRAPLDKLQTGMETGEEGRTPSRFWQNRRRRQFQGKKLSISHSKKTTKREKGVKNRQFRDNIVYGRPLVQVSEMAHIGRKGNHVNLDMRDRLIGENSRME